MRGPLVRLGLLLVLVLAVTAGPARGQEATPSPDAVGEPPEPEVVQGAGSAAEAPLLAPGAYADLLLQTETLWYRVDARQGQQVAATVVVRGRPEGARSEVATLRVALLDAQRQPSGRPAEQRFSGQVDAQVEIVGDVLPEVGADGSYLTVSLTDPAGTAELADLGYQIEFGVAVGGEPIVRETATAAAPTPAPRPPAAPLPAAPAPRSTFVQVLPVVLVAFALGSAGGYELTRRRRRY